MQPLWSSADLTAALGIPVPLGIASTGVVIDSRRVRPGDIYVAIKGERQDGYAYVDSAFKARAVAALVSRPHDNPAAILVPDTHKALEDLGAYARRRFSGKVVGITGSIGKTTSKEMLARVLGVYGATYATLGNLNNHYGVPLTLANMPPGALYAVIEMGMNHAGEIRSLTLQARPDVAAITAIAPVHLENFLNLAGIAAAKAEIAEGLTPGGVFIYSIDHAEVAVLQAAGKGLRVKTTSTQQAADYQATDIQYTPHAATFSLNGALYSVSESSLALVAAATLAVATVEALGLEPQRAVEAIASYASVDGRGAVQTIPWGLDDGVITVIDQSYNSSPVAVAASLETFGRMPVRGRRIAVLGDMKELGETAAALHAGLADAVVAAGVDYVVTVGALMRHLYAALPENVRLAAVDSAAEALTAVAASIKSGDAVLVKGSHSVGLESVVAGLARGRRNAV